MPLLDIRNLHVSHEETGKEIVKGVDLTIELGEVHAVMGPNGSGKSTLAYSLMGHPAYEITDGEILFDGENLVEMEADERAQRGLFLAFQYPHAVPGVTVTNFLRSAINSIRKAKAGQEDPIPVKEFREELLGRMADLKVTRELAQRYINDGFSGGERKKMEMLQLAMLKPRMAVLDETDTGLDIDALKVVGNAVNTLVGPAMGALVITHFPRVLQYIKPNFVHVFSDGRIVAEGGPELADTLEADGYMADSAVGNVTLRARFRNARASTGEQIGYADDVRAQLPEVNYALPGLWPTGTSAAELIIGQGSALVVGVRQDMTYKLLTEAVITDNTGAVIYNLPQQDMVAMRLVFRAGWEVANPINYQQPTEASRYPFAVLRSPAS
jgi:Fe-S cluster assembly ATP-binding protein